jgi:DNA-binding NarL/FixJ family response regulator
MSATGKSSVRTRIFVLEEHPLLREGIITYLGLQPDLVVCGETDNIRHARDKIATCKPHLLITALRLGAGDSLEFVKALKTEHPALLILVYSAFEEGIFAERALRAGAEGFVMKKAPKEELVGAIREIVNGNIYVSREMAMRAFKKSLETRPDYSPGRPATEIEKLSDREMHVFHLLGSGLGNRQMAQSLHLSVKTIESHRENIKHKLGLASGRELVGCATKYVEEHVFPSKKVAIGSLLKGKKKVVRFPAA